MASTGTTVKAAILIGRNIISTRKRDGRNIGNKKDIMVIMTTDITARHPKKPHFLGNAAFFTPNITRFAEA